MPKDPLGILKPKNNEASAGNSDPLGILKKRETAAPSDKAQPSNVIGPLPVQKRFLDIFKSDNLLDRDLASAHANTLLSANNKPTPKYSLTGFNQEQASKNSLTPSFEESRQSEISSTKNDPDKLRDYRKKRVKEIDDDINSTRSQLVQNVDPSTTIAAGLSYSSFDPTSTNQRVDHIRSQEIYRTDLN